MAPDDMPRIDLDPQAAERLIAGRAGDPADLPRGAAEVSHVLDAVRRAATERDDSRMPRAPRDGGPVLAAAFSLGSVGAAPVSRHLTIAYDDLESIQYFGTPLRPYWRRHGMDARPECEHRSAAREGSQSEP